MDQKITVEELVRVIEESDLDPTIKSILIRDVRNEGVTEFLLEQVIAYCDNAAKYFEELDAQEKSKST